MENSLIDYTPVTQMFNHDPLEKSGCDIAVPDALRVDNDDGTTRAHTQAWSLAALHPVWPEKKSFSLQK